MRSADKPQRASRPPLCPDRIRSTNGGFAFIENRFLRDGFFASLTHIERSVYLFFVLAADRSGISFYGYDRICSIVEITLDDFVAARRALVEKDLLATDGTRTQVLSLPQAPAPSPLTLQTTDDFETHDPATIRQILSASLAKR